MLWRIARLHSKEQDCLYSCLLPMGYFPMHGKLCQLPSQARLSVYFSTSSLVSFIIFNATRTSQWNGIAYYLFIILCMHIGFELFLRIWYLMCCGIGVPIPNYLCVLDSHSLPMSSAMFLVPRHKIPN